jgi:hypothetical protein
VLICAALSVSASRVRVACCEKSQLEGISETPFPAALSLPLRLASSASRQVVVVGGDPEPPFSRCARPGRCIWRLGANKGRVCEGQAAAHTGRDCVGAAMA